MHKEEQLMLRNVLVFNVSEFYPLSASTNSNLGLSERVVGRIMWISTRRTSILLTVLCLKDDIFEFCRQYEQHIQSFGGIDYILLGVGHASNIGFNGPGSSVNVGTRLVLLDNDARKEAARTFKSIENVPASVITMGISTIMKAKNVILMAWGEDKSHIVANTVEGKVSETVPSTYLQNHMNAKAVIDLSAAYELTRISHPCWLPTVIGITN